MKPSLRSHTGPSRSSAVSDVQAIGRDQGKKGISSQKPSTMSKALAKARTEAKTRAGAKGTRGHAGASWQSGVPTRKPNSGTQRDRTIDSFKNISMQEIGHSPNLGPGNRTTVKLTHDVRNALKAIARETSIREMAKEKADHKMDRHPSAQLAKLTQETKYLINDGKVSQFDEKTLLEALGNSFKATILGAKAGNENDIAALITALEAKRDQAANDLPNNARMKITGNEKGKLQKRAKNKMFLRTRKKIKKRSQEKTEALMENMLGRTKLTKDDGSSAIDLAALNTSQKNPVIGFRRAVQNPEATLQERLKSNQS
ncbi:hypothetical protein SCOR_28055 [Sulfidibacter corallicola]